MNKFFNAEINQISIFDDHFYESLTQKGTWYPSVTTKLNAYYKGHGLMEWVKSNGFNADIIMDRAAIQGRNVHNAIDSFLNGVTLTWIELDGKENYTLTEWQMINRFMEFYKRFKPEILVHEQKVVSDKMKTGGTIDLICKINNEILLIDYKTGEYLYKSNFIQIATYKAMWEELNPQYPISRLGVLHLNAKTRTKGKNNDIQGISWQVKFADDSYEHLMKLWDATALMFDEENPNYKPKNLVYPNQFIKEI